MQRGCIKRNSRKRGPEVWQFRWSEIGPDGKRHHHKKILGTVEQYPDENGNQCRYPANESQRDDGRSTL